eukprot:5371771-Pyramimonas_sp.AAC.2
MLLRGGNDGSRNPRGADIVTLRNTSTAQRLARRARLMPQRRVEKVRALIGGGRTPIFALLVAPPPNLTHS